MRQFHVFRERLSCPWLTAFHIEVSVHKNICSLIVTNHLLAEQLVFWYHMHSSIFGYDWTMNLLRHLWHQMNWRSTWQSNAYYTQSKDYKPLRNSCANYRNISAPKNNQKSYSILFCSTAIVLILIPEWDSVGSHNILSQYNVLRPVLSKGLLTPS